MFIFYFFNIYIQSIYLTLFFFFILFLIIKNILSSNIVFLKDLYNVSNNKMSQTGMFSHNTLLKSNKPDCYKISIIKEDLLD